MSWVNKLRLFIHRRRYIHYNKNIQAFIIRLACTESYKQRQWRNDFEVLCATMRNRLTPYTLSREQLTEVICPDLRMPNFKRVDLIRATLNTLPITECVQINIERHHVIKSLVTIVTDYFAIEDATNSEYFLQMALNKWEREWQ